MHSGKLKDEIKNSLIYIYIERERDRDRGRQRENKGVQVKQDIVVTKENKQVKNRVRERDIVLRNQDSKKGPNNEI